MTTILVLQSFREHDAPSWMHRCMASVRDWCSMHGYEYRFRGDDLFDLLPSWYRDKVGQRLPVAADLARLIWAQKCLAQNQCDLVVWLDADTYVFAPDALRLDPEQWCSHSQFGLEHWVQSNGAKVGLHKKARLHKNVHNAYCAFKPGGAELDFLVDAIQRIIRRVDVQHIAPQMVGPKLLSSLHNIVGFELDARFGAISPMLADELLGSPGAGLKKFMANVDEPMCSANLCGSLQGQADAQDLNSVDQRLHQLMNALDVFKNGLR